MPRDKKTIHRATSDVEDDDEIVSDEENHKNIQDSEQITIGLEDTNTLLEERKKYLRHAILKRSLALKQQREKSRQQKVSSTQHP